MEDEEPLLDEKYVSILSVLRVEELELVVLHMFDEVHGSFEPLAAIHGLVLVEKAVCANAEIVWAAATKRFLLPLQPLLTQQQKQPNLLDLRRIVTLMQTALRCESFSYVGREREGDEDPALGCSDCNEYNFKLSLQPPTRTTRQSQSEPVCSISWQCTKVASSYKLHERSCRYKPLTPREARQWDTERVEVSTFAAPRFTMVSNSNSTASRARCRYTFEQAFNGLLVRLTNGSVLTGSSGPKYQLGWGVLDDHLLVPRMQMLPLPPPPHPLLPPSETRLGAALKEEAGIEDGRLPGVYEDAAGRLIGCPWRSGIRREGFEHVKGARHPSYADAARCILEVYQAHPAYVEAGRFTLAAGKHVNAAQLARLVAAARADGRLP